MGITNSHTSGDFIYTNKDLYLVTCQKICVRARPTGFFFNSSSELNIDVPYMSGDGSVLSL